MSKIEALIDGQKFDGPSIDELAELNLEIDDLDADIAFSGIESDDIVGLYFASIRQFPLLSAKEEIDLARTVKDGDEQQSMEARNKLIESNLRLSAFWAKRYLHRGMEFPDLIEEGNLGLFKAVDKYDLELGFRFSTYATWWIQQNITRAIADKAKPIRIPVHQVERISGIKETWREMQAEGGATPSLKDLAAKLGKMGMPINVRYLQELLLISESPLSLDQPIDDVDGGDEATLGEFVADDQSEGKDVYQETVDRRSLTAMVDQMLRELPKKYAEVLRHRFGLNGYTQKTLEETADLFKLSRERVRQIEDLALTRLKQSPRSIRLRDLDTND